VSVGNFLKLHATFPNKGITSVADYIPQQLFLFRLLIQQSVEGEFRQHDGVVTVMVK
jgi:hypothetical protein